RPEISQPTRVQSGCRCSHCRRKDLMAVNQVVLVFSLRTRPGLNTYYRRLPETGAGKRGEFPKTEPELDDDIQQAARFSPEQGVALRQIWRSEEHTSELQSH